ncbi:MAG TPA: hypothetical protein VJI32_01480 [Candidatus Nanoarchaeia archaeon]|nr:hypothetical protein [Candidatus Nanoarchaeia archaeon]
MSKVLIASLMVLLVLLPFIAATTLKGTIYNTDLEPETDVLVEINTTPLQKYLAKEGTYSFEVAPGQYLLTATKSDLTISEELTILPAGTFVFDLFLLPDFADENELWQETQGEVDLDENVLEKTSPIPYIIAGLIIIFALYRFIKMRRKYGSLWAFRKRMKLEHHKTLAQHQEDLAKEPGYIDEALNIIQKHDGRMTQKDLRKEMLHLSEAKVSLIITELEHKGKIEKIKKGRGNVIIVR